ncbi:hypothetical protein PTE30175_03501 [Pandoraea terrae]|uniref:4-oxalocrotonate tautomerase n=1 Tax=Pandoraea terrae TaxID=1537710 RepID=A0A5E4X145_9BURK|nr:hypothetical protein PTE30175_03501 [Pandoraea terrae]
MPIVKVELSSGRTHAHNAEYVADLTRRDVRN